MHDPSWYWFEHCYATFITDPAGLDLLPRIGADRVLWSADYPHFESSLGYSRRSLASVFEATTVRRRSKSSAAPPWTCSASESIPMTLTEQQLTALDRDGYVAPLLLRTAGQMDELRSAVDTGP